MSRVLVTGGAGFIGANLLRQIDPSHDVRVLDNLLRGQRELLPGDREIELVVGDIRKAFAQRPVNTGCGPKTQAGFVPPFGQYWRKGE